MRSSNFAFIFVLLGSIIFGIYNHWDVEDSNRYIRFKRAGNSN